MPIETSRATSRFPGAGIAGNLGVGMALCVGSTVAAALLDAYAGGRWGHVAAVAFMPLGILVMMKPQEGHVPPLEPDQG